MIQESKHSNYYEKALHLLIKTNSMILVLLWFSRPNIRFSSREKKKIETDRGNSQTVLREGMILTTMSIGAWHGGVSLEEGS